MTSPTSLGGEHTAGPWAYRRTHRLSDSYWFVVVDRDGRGPIVDVGGGDLSGQIAEAKHLITDEREIEANARLIAAAPDLLKALEELLPTIRSVDSETTEAIIKARTTIARTKGASHGSEKP